MKFINSNNAPFFENDLVTLIVIDTNSKKEIYLGPVLDLEDDYVNMLLHTNGNVFASLDAL